MTNTKATRALVEGAFLAALAVLIAAVGLYLPWLFFVTALLFPVPLILMVYRHGLKKGIMSLLVTGVLLLMLYPDPLSITLLMVQLGPVALVLGWLFRNQVSAGKSIVVAAITAALLMVLVTGLMALLLGINPFEITEHLHAAKEASKQFYQDAGFLKDEQAQKFQEVINNMISTVVLLLPGILISSAMISTLLTYLLARAIMVRLHCSVPVLASFSQWTYPWYTLWGVIAGLILILVGDAYALEIITQIGQNLLYIFGIALMLLGLSVAVYYYKKITWPKVIKIILVILLVMWPYTPFILAIVGMLDAVMDIRQLNKKRG
ncbi:YybS family protein [Peptococcaceae bacterium]|nr:YybS family protein [Peptococcaceae bacterium]